MEKAAEPEKKPRKRKLARRILIFLAVLLCIRIALPYVILYFANKKLATLDGYYGHVDDINLALYRGAYVIRDINIKKVDGKDTTDFFSCPRIDLSVEWRAIWHKKFVGEVEFEQPVIKYTLNKTIGKKAPKDSTDFIQLVKDFMPIRINHFAVTNGQIHYVDQKEKYDIDLPMTEVNIDGTGLTNKPAAGVVLPASIVMKSRLYEGILSVSTRLDPLSKVPTFDLNAAMTKTNLVNMNPLFKAYGNFDVERGSLSLYTEVAAKDGEFAGYVKPLITDIKVVTLDKKEGTPIQIAWEAFLGGTVQVFSNYPKDQFATKVPFNGKFTRPHVAIGEAIFAVLRNAFVEALRPSLDNTITISNVEEQNAPKGFFDRLLKGNDSNSEKKKKKKK